MNKPSAEEMQEFMGQVAMFKDMKKSMVSNMTCVLTKLGKLDKNLGMYLLLCRKLFSEKFFFLNLSNPKMKKSVFATLLKVLNGTSQNR